MCFLNIVRDRRLLINVFRNVRFLKSGIHLKVSFHFHVTFSGGHGPHQTDKGENERFFEMVHDFGQDFGFNSE